VQQPPANPNMQNEKKKIESEEDFIRSPFRVAWIRLKRHRLALFGGIVLAIMYFSVILAPLYAPHDPYQQYRGKSYHPPVTVHVRDEDGNWRWPFIYNSLRGHRYMIYGYIEKEDPLTGEILEEELDLGTFDVLDRAEAHGAAEEIAELEGVDDFTYFPIMRIWVEDKQESPRYPLKLFVEQEREFSILGLTGRTKILGLGEPSFEDPYPDRDTARVFLYGTDQFGRDNFSRVLHGGRVSLFIGIVALMISTFIGMIFGGISGYYGGWIDNLMMRLAEVVMSFPQLYLLMALAAVLPLDMTSATRFFLIVVILAFVGWAGMARVIRGMVLSIRAQDFVEAARALGGSDLRIIVRHVLPNTYTYVIVAATLALPGYILMEAALSFLGLGIQQPQASWGNMLSAAQSVRVLTENAWLLVPGFFIFVAVLAFSFLGDGIRDAFDPKTDV